MKNDDLDTKQRIMKATIELLKEKDLDGVTMRLIAERANVALSALNYHFQTKENLISQSVQVIIGDRISTWYDRYNSLTGDPVTKLKTMLRDTASFLAKYPRISRVSIIYDLLSGGTEDDHSMQTNNAYLTALKEIYGNQKNEQDLKIMVHQIIAAGQVALLRADIFKSYTGIDFFNDQQRDMLIDKLVDNIIRE
ncbi:MAG: TetR/AcrR family transcriptional regulator [Promethearchaeota archaeon]